MLAPLTLALAVTVSVAIAAPGDLDTSFGTGGVATADVPGGADYAYQTALQADGKIVVAGRVCGGCDFALIRFSMDGSLDAGFGSGGIVTTDISGGSDEAIEIATQSDGKIVVAGVASGDFALARYNTNGSLDLAFGVGGTVTLDFGGFDVAEGLAIQTDGKIVAGGNSTCSPCDLAVARFNTDGSLDLTFGVGGKTTTDLGGNESASALALQSDGKIVLGGNNGSLHFTLVRYDTFGASDATFGSGGVVSTSSLAGGSITALLIQSDGKIVGAGWTQNPVTKFAAARYNLDGSPDTSFGTGGTVETDPGDQGVMLDAALQANGKIVGAGYDHPCCPAGGIVLIRYNTDGSLDAGFGSAGIAASTALESATAVAIQADGKIVTSGCLDACTTIGVARFLGDPVGPPSVGPPTDKDQCKNGGWQTFNTPRTFQNQGDCIQYVNTGK